MRGAGRLTPRGRFGIGAVIGRDQKLHAILHPYPQSVYYTIRQLAFTARPYDASVASASRGATLPHAGESVLGFVKRLLAAALLLPASACAGRSEEHTSELQSLMRISYAVFCLKKKTVTSVYTTQITQY